MKTNQLKKNAEQRVERGKWPALLVAILVAAMFCILFFFIWGSRVTNSDFEGTIVDRWADYAESEQGSKPRLRLVVESQDGKRFTVNVDPNVYESARAGMRIKSRSGQIVLIDSDGRTNNDK